MGGASLSRARVSGAAGGQSHGLALGGEQRHVMSPRLEAAAAAAVSVRARVRVRACVCVCPAARGAVLNRECLASSRRFTSGSARLLLMKVIRLFSRWSGFSLIFFPL